MAAGSIFTSSDRYLLPRNITAGLGWTSEGTVNLGSTVAFLSPGVLMPENDGKIYGWDESIPGIVRQLGSINVDGAIELMYQLMDEDNHIHLTFFEGQLIAVEAGNVLLLPDDSILTVCDASGNIGTFIMVSDQFAKSYIGASNTKFNTMHAEGLILDNVIISGYQAQGIIFAQGASGAYTHVENVLFDDNVIPAIVFSTGYKGDAKILNNTLDGQLTITNVNIEANITVRNNTIKKIVITGSSPYLTDFSKYIRNNYFQQYQTIGAVTLPVVDEIGDGWYTLEELNEMEAYSGNIVAPDVLPLLYGFIRGYGKVNMGMNGGLPYLLPLDKVWATRQADKEYMLHWNQLQPDDTNFYRIGFTSNSADLLFLLPYVIKTGNTDKFLWKDGLILDTYPADNDGNGDGVLDAVFSLTTNALWQICVQPVFMLGEKIISHVASVDHPLNIPVRELGKPPEEPSGLKYPVQIVNGAFALSKGDDCLREGVISTVMTNPGERVLYPNGAGLRGIVFEGFLDSEFISVAREHLRNEIENLNPGVKIVAIQFNDTEIQGQRAFDIRIAFRSLITGELNTSNIPGISYGL